MINSNKEIYVYENYSELEPLFIGTLYVNVIRGEEVYSFSYDNKNRISTIQYNNEDLIQYTYDDYFGRVTSINEDDFIYDEFSNIKTISNNVYTKRNIIDYRTNQLFQNIEIADSNIVVNEISNNTSNDYADLVNELIATSEYSTFFRKKRFETNNGIKYISSALMNNHSGEVASYINNEQSYIQNRQFGVMLYSLFNTYSSYQISGLQDNLPSYQIIFLFKKTSSNSYLRVYTHPAWIQLKFYSNETFFSVGDIDITISSSYLDNSFHVLSINISRSGLVQLLIDGTTVASINYGDLINRVEGIDIPSGNELFGLILNTDNYCFDSQTIIDIYNNYRKIIQKQSDNLIDSVYYPTITMSSTLSLPDYEYYSFNKTYNSSSGKKPFSITYSLVNRDEDSDFVFDTSLKRYVYSTLNKTLKYIVSRYSNGTVSFFVKPLDANQAFIKLGILEIGINNQRKLYLKSGTTTRTSTSTLSQNKYYSIVVTYSFVTSVKCNITIYLDGVSAIVLLTALRTSAFPFFTAIAYSSLFSVPQLIFTKAL